MKHLKVRAANMVRNAIRAAALNKPVEMTADMRKAFVQHTASEKRRDQRLLVKVLGRRQYLKRVKADLRALKEQRQGATA